MQNADRNASTDDYYDDYSAECQYIGTDFLEVKIYLICVFALIIALFSLISNSFFVVVFVLNVSLRRSSLYYFGILAVLDAILAINYILLMVCSNRESEITDTLMSGGDLVLVQNPQHTTISGNYRWFLL